MRLSIPMQVVLALVVVAVLITLDVTVWPHAMSTATGLAVVGQMIWGWRQGKRKEVGQVLLLMLFAAALFIGVDYIESTRTP